MGYMITEENRTGATNAGNLATQPGGWSAKQKLLKLKSDKTKNGKSKNEVEICAI